jgi:hypothetical protein
MEIAAHRVDTEKHVSVIRWVVAIALAVSAAASYTFYVAQGIVVGALIGLPGRQGDVLLAQHNALYWLAAFAVLQVGLIIAIFSILQFGADATPFARFIGRGTAAAFLSIPATLIGGLVIFAVLQLQRQFWPHSR